MRRLAVSALLGATFFIAWTHTASGRDDLDEKLRDELVAMFDEDQAARNKLNDWLKANAGKNKTLPPDAPEVKKLQEVDRKNTTRLKAIVAKYGWPGKTLVGEQAANAAWLLVQHADHDRPFQRQCLKLMEEAAKKGEVSKRDVAYLVDRLLVADGKRQRYGTQFKLEKGEWIPNPIEDPASVDKRRAELDMPPLAEYKKMILEQYKGKAKEEKK
jgi:uncharacterized protein DUF6624